MAVSLLGSAWTTTAGNKTVTATPAAGDLIVVICASTGLSGGPTSVSDNNSDGNGTYTQVDSDRTGFSTTGTLCAWVRDSLVGSGTSTVFTSAQAGSTGGGLAVYKITGMTLTGAAAVRSSGGQSSGGSGTTPAPVLSLTPLSASAIIAAVCNGTNGSTTVTPRTGYTEDRDSGYGTPAAGFESSHLASGETSATITFGSTTASAFASIALEISNNTAPTVALNSPSDTATGVSTTPALQFTGTDADSDDITYEVQVDTVNTFDSQSVNIGRLSSQDATGGSTATYPATPTAGHLLLALGFGNGTPALSGWTSIASATNGSSTLQLFARTSTGTEGTVGNAGFSGMSISEFQGLDNPYATDGTAGGNNTGGFVTSTTTPNITTTNANDVIIVGAWGNANNSGQTWTTSTMFGLNNSISGGFIALGQDIVSTTKTGFNDTITVNSSTFLFTVIAAFKQTSVPKAPLIDATSASGGHDAAQFSGTPDNTDPYTSGQAVTFTVPSGETLTASTTYYWRVRGKDPSGSNTFGSWSSDPVTPAFVQGNTNYSAGSGTSSTCAYSSNVTNGNLLVVAVGSDLSGTFGDSVTDSQGNVYTKADTANQTSIPYQISVWYAIASATGANTVTFSHNTGTLNRIAVHEYSGVNTLDAHSSNTGATGVPDSGTATTTQATELIFGWGISNGGITSAGSGFNLRETAQSESTEDKNVTSTGSYSAAFPSGATAWAAIMATFYNSAWTFTTASGGSTVTKTQSATARIAANLTKTQSALARIAKNLTKTQSALSRIATNPTKTQSAISRIANNKTSAQSAIARIQRILTKTQSAVARIVNPESKTQSAIARIAQNYTKTQSAISRIANNPTKTQSAIARIAKLITKTQPATATIKTTVSKTQSAISRVANNLTKTQTATARIQRNLTNLQTAIARIVNPESKTQSAIARIAQNYTKTQTAISRIANIVTRTQGAIARITANLTKTQTGVARIATNLTSTQSAISRIAVNPTATQSAVAKIVQAAVSTKTQSAVARIANNLTKTQSAISRIANVITKTQSAISRIANNLTSTQGAVARIQQTVSKTQPAISRIQQNLTKTQTATARIDEGFSKTQSAIARIANSLAKTQSAIARIANNETKTQPATATIKTVVTKTQSAISRVANNLTKTQFATARIDEGFTKTQSTIARIANSLTKTQPSTARIAVNLTKTQGAIARIAINSTLTQPAVSRVANNLTKTQSAVASITTGGGFIKTQPAISRIANNLTKTQSCKASILTNVPGPRIGPGMIFLTDGQVAVKVGGSVYLPL